MKPLVKSLCKETVPTEKNSKLCVVVSTCNSERVPHSGKLWDAQTNVPIARIGFYLNGLEVLFGDDFCNKPCSWQEELFRYYVLQQPDVATSPI